MKLPLDDCDKKYLGCEKCLHPNQHAEHVVESLFKKIEYLESQLDWRIEYSKETPKLPWYLRLFEK